MTFTLLILTSGSVATAQQFQILRAEYRHGNRWVDVTTRLRELADSAATFRLSNDTFRVNPVRGTVKSLRIYAGGPRGETRTFEYPEGSIVDGSQFSNWKSGNWSPGTGGQYQILRADYGFANQQADVPQQLRDLMRTDQSFRAGNDTFGVDPAPGRAKTLRIYAGDPRGNTPTFEYREGRVVDGSQFTDWNRDARKPDGMARLQRTSAS